MVLYFKARIDQHNLSNLIHVPISHGQVPGYSKSKPDKEPVMRIIVNVCNDYALEESVFTADETASKAEHRDIRLPKERFRLQSDQVIALTISNKGLTFVEENSNVYCHITDKSNSHESTFSKDMSLSLKTRNGEDLTMLVFFGSETAMSFYRTKRSRVISLGKGLKQSICSIDSELLSDAHMILRRTDKGDKLNVKGERGCYLNGRYIPCMNTARKPPWKISTNTRWTLPRKPPDIMCNTGWASAR